MNDSQGPPLHYPNSQDLTTIDIFRPPRAVIGTGGGRHGSSRRARNFSCNDSPYFQPPAYGADSCPPQYQEPRNHGSNLPQNCSHYHHLVQQQQARQLSQLSQSSQETQATQQYVEVDEEQLVLERRKTMKIRLAASLSIVLVVALVVAGTVGKISSMQKHGYYLGGDGNMEER